MIGSSVTHMRNIETGNTKLRLQVFVDLATALEVMFVSSSGLTLRGGGALDGAEAMAVIFVKRLGITVGQFVMSYNVILYVIASLVCRSWHLPLYSIITYYVGLQAVDFIVEGINRSKSVMIVTEKADAVSQALMEAFACGTTKLPAKGGFTNAEKT